MRVTTEGSQTATEPRHWSNETADDAVQAAFEARALMLATAWALGLPDERVEDAPQEAAEMRALVRALEAALHEILDEAHSDFDRDVILTAARGALVEDE